MNIADRLNPQDGRFGFKLGIKRGRFPDRLAADHAWREHRHPYSRQVARHACRSTELGFSDENLVLLKRLVKRPEGIIIVTGPTGSGKTTTLYSVLAD